MIQNCVLKIFLSLQNFLKGRTTCLKNKTFKSSVVYWLNSKQACSPLVLLNLTSVRSYDLNKFNFKKNRGRLEKQVKDGWWNDKNGCKYTCRTWDFLFEHALIIFPIMEGGKKQKEGIFRIGTQDTAEFYPITITTAILIIIRNGNI